MPTYTLISGETISYKSTPELDDFYARARVAAEDPTVSVGQMIDLLYGEGNPLLTRGVIPGRGMVSLQVLQNPAYRVMLDLIDIKRIQAGAYDPEAAAAACTITVAEAARRLGVTPSAVRQAIASGRLASVKRGGQHYMRESALASFQLARRGPRAAEERSPVLQVRLGTDGVAVLHLRHDGELTRTRKVGPVSEGELEGWTWGVVKSARKDAGSVRAYHIRPGAAERTLDLGSLFIRGRFDIVVEIRDGKEAMKAWNQAARDGGSAGGDEG